MIPEFAHKHNYLGKDFICELTRKRCGFGNILYCCACPEYMNRDVVNYIGYKKERRAELRKQGEQR